MIFAGYKIPHPLEYRMLIKVRARASARTRSPARRQLIVHTPLVQVQTNGKKTPVMVVLGALEDLGAEVADIRTQFQKQLDHLGTRGRDGV